MAFAIAPSSVFRPVAACFARGLSLAALLALTGCIGDSAFDDLNSAQPIGSPFEVALFKDYAYLARSFGTQSEPAGQAFDADGSISLTAADNTVSGLANAYAQKALAAAKAEEDVLPEAAPDGDTDAENVRLELLQDLDDGRDKAPEDAARAQADYDCWIMDRHVDAMAVAAKACRRSLTGALALLERDNGPDQEQGQDSDSSSPPPAPAPTPTAPPPAAAQPVEFTVDFGFRSAALTPDQLATVSQAIATARTGRQAHITVVGHTDTEENSQKLSLRRAEAVEAALVQQGARPEAIEVSGVGKDDPAVQTADHVKEPQNRRAVITLVP